MKICVLVKQVPDKDSEINLSSDGLSINRQNLNLITNESDNYAIEEALLLKEKHEAEIVICSFGEESAIQVIKDALPGGKIVQQATGALVNPMKFQSFTGVDFRDYSYKFDLKPSTPQEAFEIKKIIAAFKLSSLESSIAFLTFRIASKRTCSSSIVSHCSIIVNPSIADLKSPLVATLVIKSILFEGSNPALQINPKISATILSHSTSSSASI